LRYSTANSEKTGHLNVSAGWNRWALATSFTRYDYGDLRMGKHGPDEYLKLFYVQRINDRDSVFSNNDPRVQRPSGYTQTNLMQKIRFRPNDAWDIQYGFHYSETSSYGRYDRLIETNNQGVPRSAVWDYGPQKWMMNLLAVTHSGQNPVYDRMNLRLAYQSFEESRIDRRLNNARLRTQQENIGAISVNADFLKFTGQNRLIYGFEYVHNNVESKASAVNIITQEDIKVPDRYPASTWASYAAYLSYQHRFNPIWLLQAGVRMSHFKIDADFTRLLDFYPFDYSSADINNQALTGSIGTVFTPTEFWKLSADLSTGFRAPNVDDIGKMFDFQVGDVIVPNPGLKAEYAYNGEVTIARRFGEALDVDFTGFYTMLDHAMVRRPFQVDGQDSISYNGTMSRIFALQNTAQAHVYGFNTGFELKLPGSFSVSSRFNYQKGEEEMEDGSTSPSRHAAPWFGVARLIYSTEKINIQLYSAFSGEVSHENLNAEERQKPTIYATDENGNPYSPAWHTLNLKTMYQLSSRLTVAAGIENITNQRYRPYSSGLVAPGRNFVFSLVAEF
jgi:hemoglobin/transferrin/lactoferrin receptor protein